MTRGKILLAKTSLDGHWRGVMVVARALRDAGFEVVYIGMATREQIVAAAIAEDVNLVGLNVGGRVEVVHRVIDTLADELPTVPVFAGGTIAPWAATQLETRRVRVFPPGSPIAKIIRTADELIAAAADA